MVNKISNKSKAERGIITVARKDYVRNDRSEITYRKQRKKKSNSYDISQTLLALGVALAVILIGCFYFISRDKPHKVRLLTTQNTHTDYLLPPKPKERWYYVNEFKNRKADVFMPPASSSGNNTKAQIRLTDEQYQLLKQMQSDMRDTVASLPVVSDHDLKLKSNPDSLSVNQAQKQETAKTSPKSQILQCAAFREIHQANSFRAQLALEGIESKINTADGWSRVILGPYKSPSEVNQILQKLEKTGINHCIPVKG